MATHVETDMSAFEADFRRRRVAHWFPKDPRYRLSGAAMPQPGDIAYCGIVKKNGPTPRAAMDGIDDCAQCVRLKRMVEGF